MSTVPEIPINQSMDLAVRQVQLGNLAAGKELCTQIVRAIPDYASAVHLLGVIALQEGDLALAEKHLRRAVALAPQAAEFHNNLGVLLRSIGKLDEAVNHFRTAIRLKTDYADAMSNLGALLGYQGDLTASVELNRKAAELRPGGDTLNNYGNALMRQGKVADSIAAYRRGLEILPDDPRTWSNLLLTSNYDPSLSRRELFDEHVRWGRRLGELAKAQSEHRNVRDAGKRLRVGYISPDFRAHSVCYFIFPLLEHHDRAQVEVFCYSNTSSEDELTARAKSLTDTWRSILGMPDSKAAEMIRGDAIDILVDLASHTAGNRIPLMALKPAPVQVSYLGYPNTSGLAVMDYRLTDSLADPPGESDELTVEKLVRIDPCAWCYQPHAIAPEVQPPPSEANGFITFGSFNALTKVNANVIATWARILREVPTSRLAIKCGAFADPPTKDRIRAAFADHGIAPDRIDLRGHFPRMSEHLSAYARIDIALDTFHYNGTTTTCEALWMGVPVVTLAGDAHAGRVGVSLLSAVGLPDLIATSIDDYVRLAVNLGSDASRLAELRRTMRDRMRSSPLMDGPGFARRVEGAYREMWRAHCSKDGATTMSVWRLSGNE